MADSIVEIFNDEITPADFDGGYDVITTDANTSYVIKDVATVGGYYDSLPATINDFPVGDYQGSLTGSEIVDVNSNLNIAPTPYIYDNVNFQISINSDNRFEEKTAFLVSDTFSYQSEAESSPRSLTGLRAWSTVQLYYPVYKIGDSFYQISSTPSSTASLYFWPSSGAEREVLSADAYQPHFVSLDEQEVYYFHNDSLYKHNPTDGTVGPIASAQNSFSTNSSAYYLNGYMFYIPQSGISSSVYAINVTNGARFVWTGLEYVVSVDNIAVSYDENSDKFHIYRKPHDFNDINNYPMARDILDQTKTELDALTGDNTLTATSETKNSSDLAQDLIGFAYTFFCGARFEGSKTIGGDLYYQTVSLTDEPISVYKYNWDSEETILVSETGYTANNSSSFMGVFSPYEPSASEISQTPYDPPLNVKLRITGVKSTTT